MTTHNNIPAARLESIMDAGEKIGDGPVRVGELVVMHGRGAWRVAKVTKVTKGKVHGVYTTEGAIETAARYGTPVITTKVSADRDRAFRVKS